MMTEQQIKAQLDGKFFRFNDDGEVTSACAGPARENSGQHHVIAMRAKALLCQSPSQQITIGRIVTAVAAATDIHWDLIKGRKREPKQVRARCMVYWLARRFTKRTLPQIGLALGRDHSTVLHGLKLVDDIRSRFEPELSQAMELLGVQG